jgi:hypothetical protein
VHMTEPEYGAGQSNCAVQEVIKVGTGTLFGDRSGERLVTCAGVLCSGAAFPAGVPLITLVWRTAPRRKIANMGDLLSEMSRDRYAIRLARSCSVDLRFVSLSPIRGREAGKTSGRDGCRLRGLFVVVRRLSPLAGASGLDHGSGIGAGNRYCRDRCGKRCCAGTGFPLSHTTPPALLPKFPPLPAGEVGRWERGRG